jgi:hypothetical protein
VTFATLTPLIALLVALGGQLLRRAQPA